jgi:hypothetical protein
MVGYGGQTDKTHVILRTGRLLTSRNLLSFGTGGRTRGGTDSKARLLGRVGDFEPMNQEAGENENCDGKTEQAEDGDERRDRFGDDGKDGHGTFNGQFDGAEMLQIESDA